MITLFCVRPRGFNIGNEAIFVAMQPFLHRAFGEVVNLISIPATARYETHVQAGLTARTTYEMNQYGHGVIVGGGNLYENGEIDVDQGALEALEAPLMLFSLSRGRIYNRRHRLVPRTNAMSPASALGLNRKAGVSLARDRATLHFLHEIGASHAQLGGCPTLFLRDAEHRLPDLPQEKEPPVLVSVRNPQLMSIPLRKQIDVHGDITRIVAFLRSEGHGNVKLLCHDHRDIPFAASFPDVDFVYTDDVFNYLALLRSCRLNVTYRMHSALPCLSLGRPMIKISYDERAVSLMDTIGLGEWNVNMIDGPPVLDAVVDRYRRLAALEEIKASAQPVWGRLHDSMTRAMSDFAEAVCRYRDELG